MFFGRSDVSVNPQAFDHRSRHAHELGVVGGRAPVLEHGRVLEAGADAVAALDFLLKPVREERFRTALERARRELARGDARETPARLSALLDHVRGGRGEEGPRRIERFAVRTRDRDAAILAVFRALEALAWEFGRLLPNERPVPNSSIWKRLGVLR